MRTDPPPGPAPFGVVPPTDAPGPAAAWTAEAGGGAHPCPQGTSGSANQQAPCWPTAAPAPRPLPRASAFQNPRWRDPGRGVLRPEFGHFSAPCCCRLVTSSGVTAWEATPGPPVPRAPQPRCHIAVSSTNTASRGRTWCRATGPCLSGPTRGVSRGRGRGAGSHPRLAPPSLRLLSAAHLVRGGKDPLGSPSCRAALGP